MKLRWLFAIAVGLILLLPASSASAQAETPGAPPPGNYCIGCHTPGDPRLDSATAWSGGVAAAAAGPCPAEKAIQEELYYTERLLLAIQRLRLTLPDSAEAARLDARLASTRQGYDRLLDAPVSSLDAFTAEAQSLRYQLGKVYTGLLQLSETGKQQRVLVVAALVTLALLISLGWGLRNAHTALLAARQAPASPLQPAPGLLKPSRGVLLALIFVLFALPLFTYYVQETTASTPEQQELQTRLDAASRSAAAAERGLGRGWMLARVAARQAAAGSPAAAQLLDEALASLDETHRNQAALWGQAQAAYEAAPGWEPGLEKALLAAGEVEASRHRVWGLRMLGVEAAPFDPRAAQAAFEKALALTAGGLPQQELERRALSVAWAALDPQQAAQVAAGLQDPALRAWALREIAQGGHPEQVEQAAAAARQVQDPLRRAHALAEIARLPGMEVLAAEALAGLGAAGGAGRAYALANLAFTAQDVALVEQIDPAYPAARALALLRLGQYEQAFEAAAAIADPYEQGRAQAAIAAAWLEPAAAWRIALPDFRDRALRDIAVATRDAALARQVESPYYRVDALARLGLVEEAWQASAGLADGYPLRALAQAWAETDPQAALQVVEKMGREADKAVALRYIAGRSGDAGLFERALGMALAARVRSDALAPVQASLDLADLFAQDPSRRDAALQQALEAARRISVK